MFVTILLWNMVCDFLLALYFHICVSMCCSLLTVFVFGLLWLIVVHLVEGTAVQGKLMG